MRGNVTKIVASLVAAGVFVILGCVGSSSVIPTRGDPSAGQTAAAANAATVVAVGTATVAPTPMPTQGGGGGGGAAATPTPVALTTTSLNPNVAAPGTNGITLSVAGTGFTSASTVYWRDGTVNSALTTTFLTDKLITAVVPAVRLAVATTVSVTVANSTTAVSNAQTFFVAAPPNIPAATGLKPTTGTAGTLTSFTGTGLSSATAVYFGLVKGSIVSITDTAAGTTVQVLAPTPTKIEPVDVTVETPAGIAKAGVFTYNPLTTTSLNPNNTPPGGLTPLTLSVFGTGFTTSSKVHWRLNGIDTELATTFVTDQLVTAIITPADQPATEANASVTVVDGTAVSNAQAFAITGPPVPTGGPGNAANGNPGTLVTITGTGMASTTGVYFGLAKASVISFTTTGTNTTIQVLSPVPQLTSDFPIVVDVTVQTPAGIAKWGNYTYPPLQ